MNETYKPSNIQQTCQQTRLTKMATETEMIHEAFDRLIEEEGQGKEDFFIAENAKAAGIKNDTDEEDAGDEDESSTEEDVDEEKKAQKKKAGVAVTMDTTTTVDDDSEEQDEEEDEDEEGEEEEDTINVLKVKLFKALKKEKEMKKKVSLGFILRVFINFTNQ